MKTRITNLDGLIQFYSLLVLSKTKLLIVLVTDTLCIESVTKKVRN